MARPGPLIVGQLGQSLDGRIATRTGHSHYVNGPGAIVHLHRVRALVDAVLIGIGTALADDPSLTVRHVEGPNPARVVIDPKGRLPRHAKLLAPGVRRVVLTRQPGPWPDDVEVVALPDGSGPIAPAWMVAKLAALGLTRVLVEGGAQTVSAFVAAGCLDRLHVMVNPLIIGSGQPGLVLPPIDRLDQATRPPAQVYRFGPDVLFDCDLGGGRASMSV